MPNVRIAADFVADVPIAEAGSLLGSVLTCDDCHKQMGPVYDPVQAQQLMAAHRVQTHNRQPDGKRRLVLKPGPNAQTGERWASPGPRFCKVPGCTRVAAARGWCSAHHARWRTHGDVQADIPLGGQIGRPRKQS